MNIHSALQQGTPSRDAGQFHKELKRAAASRPRGGDLLSWRLILDVLRRFKGRAALTLFCMLGAIGGQLLLTWAVRQLVDVGIPSGTEEGIRQGALLLGIAAALFAVFSGLRIHFAEGLGNRIVTELRARVFERVLMLDSPFFLRMPTGEVVSRMTADMTIVEVVSGNAVHVALRSIMVVVGAAAILFLVNWFFAVLMLVALVGAMLPLLLFAARGRRLSRIAQDRFAEAMIPVSETLGAIETVQAFGREDTAQRHFDEASQRAMQAADDRIRTKAATNGLLILLTLGALLWLAVEGLTGTSGGGASYGEMTQMLLLSLMAGAAVRDFGNVWGEIQRAAGALDRIGELINTRPAIQAPAVPKAIELIDEIVFDRVSFAYPGYEDKAALRDFSLRVREGEKLAIVGPSGSGKSTILRLLLRLYDPDQGGISIGGVDLREADPKALRSLFAMVHQDPALFSWPVAENIGFGLAGASPEAIQRAAELAQASGFIAALPRGMETSIGAAGSTLSGGQRQRIAIARALVRDAPVLLLDEATNALDAENERLIQDALNQAMVGRTTLMIAHRLTTVKAADRIIVMDEGGIVEEGTHDELLRHNGIYAHLAHLQFRE